MIRFLSAAVALLTALTFGLTSAHAVEDTWDYSVQVSAAVQASPAQITLSWPQDTNGTPSSYTVYRKAPSDTSWGSGVTLPGSTTSYTDSNVTVGTAYEYQIVKATSNYTGYGYILAGIQVPLSDNHGKVILIVDNSFTTSLAPELARLQQDLVGDGWTVIRHDVSRTASVESVKALIQADYAADPTHVKSVFLFGHVPVPYSGQLNPDGHPDHVGAWPADVYYGDVDNDWTDNTVNYVQNIDTDPADAARLTNVPGDGKFDQTQIPSHVELQVGRVDLANMPGRLTWGGPATFPSETELLRKYLDKDHAFRVQQMNPPRRAILGDYFGIRGGEAFAASGFRSFAPLVGPSNIRNLNTEFNDEQGVWVPQASQNDYLLAYACGAGSYNAMSGIGDLGLYHGADTPEMVNKDVRGVFNLIFGSWLGDWDHEDDFLRAPLCTDYGLVSVWSGRPHWFLHPMGLGKTIGFCTQLTQNNVDEYKTQINTAAHDIHIALMGDPTLTLYQVAPVSSLTGSANGGGVSLTWGASTDSAVVGYHVYRATSANGPYTRLTSSPVTGTSFTDTNAPAGATYMVRAVKLETTPSGSFYNASEGVFWSAATGTTGATSGGTTTGTTTTSSTRTTPVASSGSTSGSTSSGATGSTSGTSTSSTTGPVVATSTATNPALTTSGTTVWIDDALPAGAGGLGSTGDTWNWVSTPTPFSGTLAHRSDVASGLHEHWFGWSNAPLTVQQGDTLFTYVYLDPANPPSEIMLSWSTNSSWEHRAYWGADDIQRGSGQGRYYAGPLPATGQWVRLEVPASAVGLDGATVTAMDFACYNGGATWDASGTALPNAPTLPVSGTTGGTTTTTTSTSATNEVTYFADSLPAGAGGLGSTVDTWNWVNSNPAPYSGTASHRSDAASGLHEHWFGWSNHNLPVNTGDVMYTYVYLDPINPPSEIMLSWSTNSSWEHRAYWGADDIQRGSGQGRYHAGPLPPTGQWVRLEVPASMVGLAGANVTAMDFSCYNGAATWNKTGTYSGTAASDGFSLVGTGTSSGSTSGTTSSTSSTGGTTASSSGSTSSGSTSGTGTPSTSTTSTTGGTTSGSSSTGSTSTTSTVNEVKYFADSLPAGAGGLGSTVDTWNWVNSNPAPYSGTASHRSDAASGLHEHWFGWSNSNLPVSTGDVMYTYVYLDPINPPSEIMLSWSTNSSWEHRAYWGANDIQRGSGPGRYYAGPLPPTGQWVRLEVPASMVGLAGANVTAMDFSCYNGAATWNKTGTYSGTAATNGYSLVSSGTTGTSSGSTPSGSTSGTTSSTSSTPALTSADTVWIDDALPAGAGGLGSSGGDTWNWVSTPTPVSGTLAHRSDLASGLHEHWFGWSGNSLPIATGDKLITYVYLDPAHPPSEIMLSWSTSSSWEHRAYWGADDIARGTGAGRYYAGPLPAAGQWVRLEVPASAVGLEGSSVTAMDFSCYNGAATWDASGKSGSTTTSTSGGTTSGTSGGSTSTTSTGGTVTSTSGGTTTSSSGGTVTSTSGGTTSGTSTSSTGTPTASPMDVDVPIQVSTNSTPSGSLATALGEDVLTNRPQVGDYELRVITPTVLELRRIITKAADPATFTDWNFVDSNGNFNAPATSEFVVKANGQNIGVNAVGFRRIAAFGQLNTYDLRVEACLYLQLSSPITDGASVQVTNPDASLWPSSMNFATTMNPMRFNPAIHVNQVGYVPSFSKQAMIGYYLGSLGELNVDPSQGFKLVDAATGATVYTGTLTHRAETGYETTPLPYQDVYEADFSSFTTPGTYQLVVPGMGASVPFLINDGIAMAFTRTYELGIYEQRCGTSIDMPYTRFDHAACHTAPAEVPTADSQYDFTWKTIASYSGGNSTQTAPQLVSPATQLYPFVNQGLVDVSGGHHDAGDYSKYTIDSAQLAHTLLFTAEDIKGAGALDNLGIPESGDGISDIMQEGKWEADYISKLQDADGGFYFIVYPKTREYEGNVSPENGDTQVVWPKNTSATAASVAVLAEYGSSPMFKQAYPAEAAKFMAQAKLGWQFLMNAEAKYGLAGAYQKITFYGDEFNDHDELAWAAAAMYAATGDPQYQQQLFTWFPNPADPATFHWSWQRMYQGWGCAIRDYAFAARSGRLTQSQLDPTYLAACEGQITAAGDDALSWTQGSAYGTSLPANVKHAMQTGWFFSLETAADMAVAYQIDPKQAYIDAIVDNMNYEAGSNPVNVSFVAGLGDRRPSQMVSQYRNNNRHVLPPDGEPMSNVHSSFAWLPLYGSELSGVTFPTDGSTGTSYPLQDRFTDIWNVTTEFVTVNQAHALESAAFLATLTPAKSTAWKPTTALAITASANAKVGQPVTLSVNTAGLDLTGAQITWEAQDQLPAFGSTFTITPKTSGTNWAEVEIMWPDGRREFGRGSFTVN